MSPRAAARCCSARSRSTRTYRSRCCGGWRGSCSSPTASGRSPREQIKALDIRPPDVEARLRAFSGGNQQKVALAKWLTHAPRILLLAEPTRGMDVGAKEDVVKIVRALRDQGIAIIVFSTEPETVLSLADRVLVMRKGEIAREFADEAISKDRLLAAA